MINVAYRPGFHPRKVLLCVWWDIWRIIHWEMVPRNKTPIVKVHYVQLERPFMVNRVIFNTGNSGPQCSATHSENNYGVRLAVVALTKAMKVQMVSRPCPFRFLFVPFFGQSFKRKRFFFKEDTLKSFKFILTHWYAIYHERNYVLRWNYWYIFFLFFYLMISPFRRWYRFARLRLLTISPRTRKYAT